MSRLASWLLIPPVSSRLSEHYRHFRRHGASAFSAALGCFWMDSGLDVYSTRTPALAAHTCPAR